MIVEVSFMGTELLIHCPMMLEGSLTRWCAIGMPLITSDLIVVYKKLTSGSCPFRDAQKKRLSDNPAYELACVHPGVTFVHFNRNDPVLYAA